MAYNFPNSPTVNDTYGVYKWDGEKWILRVGGRPNPELPGSEATAFLARASSLDATHIAAYTALINGLVADGVWARLDFLHIYATQNSTTALLNLVSTNYPSANIGTPTFTADRGFLNTGSDHFDTGLLPSAGTSLLVQNSAHLSMWSNTNPASSGGWCIGVHSGPYLVICPALDSSGFSTATNDGTGVSSANANTLGHYLTNRSASNATQNYKNGALAATGSATSTGLPTRNIWSISANENGFPAISPFQTSADSAGSSLDATQALAFYNRLRTYMTTVGVP